MIMKLKDLNTNHKRPLTGKEYLTSLLDDRQIYICGERIKDITIHPAFRNSIASIAQLYDALHSSENHDILCWDTDTNNGGYTHKFFRFATSSDEIRQQRDAIAEWSRYSYGWMGRTPDYKAAFCCALGAYPEFYGSFADNAKTWYKNIQESCSYFSHAIANPPIDRHNPTSHFIKIEKETDAGVIVSGAKGMATNSALAHYNFIVGTARDTENSPDFTFMFIVPMNADGAKLISRTSYELAASVTSSPFDSPLSSRFDENDAILIMDNVFIPWENILIYREEGSSRSWAVQSGFARLFPLQACVRFAVKLDFITGLLQKSLECTGVADFRGVQSDLGEVVAWRNLFWSLTDAMWAEAQPWENGAYLPNSQASQTYHVMAPMAYNKIKKIIETNVTSGLIYLPSSVRDIKNKELNPYIEKYVRGSNGIEYIERIKILKLMWDAIGSEFGGRHELYEINYAGSKDSVRLQCLRHAYSSGNMMKMDNLVEQCLSDYNMSGWTKPHLHNNKNINFLDHLLK